MSSKRPRNTRWAPTLDAVDCETAHTILY